MSDYKTSINDLYKLRSKLASFKKDDPDRIRLQQKIDASISKLYDDPVTDPLLQQNESEPILLFPLRLETRFANGGDELWIRVYPDEIAIQMHEAALTASEINAGTDYWRYLWEHAKLPDFAVARKKAWSLVANSFGVNRAKWIFLRTRPLKLGANEDFSNIQTEADLDPGPVGSKKQTWSETVSCYIMPDILKLRMYIGGSFVFETFGKPIVQPLAVSPDPARQQQAGADLDWKGTELAWLENFDEAVDVGMAFKIVLKGIAGYDPLVGFSSITVMGIRTLYDQSPLVTPPQTAGKAALGALLEGHQYTPRGLALMSQGTPTNNTEERNSGYNQDLAFSEEKYQLDLQRYGAATEEDEMEDGKILALGLGVDPVLFQPLEHALNTDHRDAVVMNKALHPATLGFYLGDLLHPLFKAEDLSVLRAFFCSYVTGRGPLSPIRIGPQPYGILPTSNFKAFRWPTADRDVKLFQKLADLLEMMEGYVAGAIPAVSKLGQAKAPHELLDEILGLYPNSETFYQRTGYSGSFLRNCLGEAIPNNPNSQLESLITRFSSYRGTAPEGVLELKKIVFERTTVQLNGDKLVDLAPVSETKGVSIPAGVSPNIHHGQHYIGWLMRFYGRETFATIEKDYFMGTDPRIDPPVLYALLKHGMLIQLYRCVFRWLSVMGYLAPDLSLLSDGTPTANFIGAKEYLNFFRKREDISAMELMLIEAPHLPMLAPGETAVAYFLKNTGNVLRDIRRLLRNRVPQEILDDFDSLRDLLAGLGYLSGLSTARLERAMVEHLDCLTYRLDAWQTGMFYRKLQLNRSAGAATGMIIGAFGWLEGLLPAANVKTIKEKDLPAELQHGTGMPIVQADGQGGYIHAPSLIQAKAAALLRDAYLHHHDPANPDMMAVNLSSVRVRKAMEIFEGVQKGHSPGELLGYKLERFLHDQATPLDKYIPALRGAFPLVGTSLSNPGNPNKPAATQAGKPAEWVARLDGLAVVNAVKGGNAYPFGLTGQLPAAGTEADALRAGVAELQDTLDAMKDLMVAESIHQLVQGNTDRAGALLKSIHELKPPSVFESIRTPRTPVEILTHRVCIFFKPGDFDKPANPWPGVTLSPRAGMEPGLNEWLGEIIGAPDKIQCTVTEVKSRTNGIVTVADLDIQPIDLVYLAPVEFGKDPSDLSSRIAYQYRVTQALPEDIEIGISFDQAEQDHVSFSDVLPLLNLLKEVVSGSKALNAADFDLRQYPGKANAGNLLADKTAGAGDIGALVKRRGNVVAALKSRIDKLNQAVAGAVCADIRERLIDCCDLEIQGGFPVSSVGEDQVLKDALVAQSVRVVGQMEKMLDTLQQYQGLDAGKLVQAFGGVFGPAFKVLPVFHLTKVEDDEVERSGAVKEAYSGEKDLFNFITGKTNMPMDRLLQNWVNEMTRLRPKLGSFEWARLCYQTFRDRQLDVHVLQLPYEAKDSWLGVEFPAGMQSGKGKLSMLAHHYPAAVPDWQADLSGLLLDEWVEEIPGSEEQTGISFQYNQPDSQPPQTLLLAISPTEGKSWTWDTLSDVINDTLRRAKQRAVGTRKLAGTNWMGCVPGALAEFSDTKANVSLFFRN